MICIYLMISVSNKTQWETRGQAIVVGTDLLLVLRLRTRVDVDTLRVLYRLHRVPLCWFSLVVFVLKQAALWALSGCCETAVPLLRCQRRNPARGSVCFSTLRRFTIFKTTTTREQYDSTDKRSTLNIDILCRSEQGLGGPGIPAVVLLLF